VEKNREFVDAQNGKFFMRSEVSGKFDPDALEAELKLVLPKEAVIRLAEPFRHS